MSEYVVPVSGTTEKSNFLSFVARKVTLSLGVDLGPLTGGGTSSPEEVVTERV